MAGLWSRKFDHKNGETRVCKECGLSYHTMKPINKCTKCVNAAQKIIETKKRSLKKKKKQYPFNNRTHEAGARFCRIRTELSNAWKEYKETGDKEVIHSHYNKQLKEIKDNGIMEWIFDRRPTGAGRERNVRSKNMIKKDYPSTKDMPYEY